MFTRNHVFIAALALAALASNQTCCAQKPFIEGRPIPGKSYGLGVVITGDNDLSPQVIDIVCASLTDRMSAALKNDDSAELTLVQVIHSEASVGSHAQMSRLVFGYQGIDDPIKDAKKLRELWGQGRNQVEASLRKIQEIARDGRSREHDIKLRDAAMRREDFAKRANDAQAKLEALEASSMGTPEEVQSQLAEMVKQLRQLTLERISIAARREAINQRVDELRAVAESASDDPVLDELDAIVSIRQQQLDGVKTLVKTGQMPEGDMRQAEAEVVTARIELLKAKRNAKADASGATLAALNDDLSRLIIQDAESKAREEAIGDLVRKLQKEASVNSRITRSSIEGELTRARREEDRADDEVRNLVSQNEVNWEVHIFPLDEVLPAAEPEKGK